MTRLGNITIAIAAGTLLLAIANPAAAQKLYRWTDKDGKVHYSDQVPPEAVENARSELNKQGVAVKQVDRALTTEERAERDAAAAAAAEQARIDAEKARQEDMLLTSYPTEEALERSYRERFDLLDQSISSTRTGVQSQQKSLNDLLEHAASLERAGKPVPATINQSIELARRQLDEQSSYLAQREKEREALTGEHASAILNYREVKAAAEAKQAERDAK
ncbi:MAG: DUF4124 domain-containing protein [Lysobacteraceae bacterium]